MTTSLAHYRSAYRAAYLNNKRTTIIDDKKPIAKLSNAIVEPQSSPYVGR